MRRRLRAVAVGALVILGYFWTGAVAKLWLLTRDAGAGGTVGDLSARPFGGESIAGVNRGFRDVMAVYGPVPMERLLGPSAWAFLEGVGVRSRPEEADQEERRRRALERAGRIALLNPWRDHARLELAALDAVPRPISSLLGFSVPYPPGSAAAQRSRTPEPGWVTVGWVDPERWWVIRQPTGASPPRAERLCTEVLAADPSDAVAAEALFLRSLLAAERWDFRSQTADLRDLALTYPGTTPAAGAAGILANDFLLGVNGGGVARSAGGLPPFLAMAEGRSAEGVALLRHVMRHSATPPARARLAMTVAPLQAQSGDRDGARATLRAALRDVRRMKSDASSSPGEIMDLERGLLETERAVESLPEGASGPPARPRPPGLPVRARILAAGKPLSGAVAALLTIPELFQSLPPAVAPEAGGPRPAGMFPGPAPRFSPGAGMPPGMMPGATWNSRGIAFQLRQQPWRIARSNARGEVRWASVPAGAYGVLVRVGTWQLPGGGMGIAPAPLDGPVIVGPGMKLLTIRFLPAIPIEPAGARMGVPALRWRSVPGAARYRVALREGGMEGHVLAETGSGAFGLDPGVVWWRDDVRGTSVSMTPHHFVGPASDPGHRGLNPGTRYTWYVEAMSRDGSTIATSETLAAPPPFWLPWWIALRSPTEKSDRPAGRVGRRMDGFVPPGGFPGPPGQFGGPFVAEQLRSPFLEGVIQTLRPQAAPKLPKATLPRIVSNGKGLPPRGPLKIPAAGVTPFPAPSPLEAGQMAHVPPSVPPPGAGQLPPNLPPQLLARLPPGERPPSLPTSGPSPRPGVPTEIHAPLMRPAGPPGNPGRPRSVEAAGPAPRENRVELDEFGPGCRTRWGLDGAGASEADDTAGLTIGQAATLRAIPPPLTLPNGSRAILVQLVGGEAEGAVLFQDVQGREQRVPLAPDKSEAGLMAAPVPPGAIELIALTLAPRPGATPHLRALSVVVTPRGGLFGTAHKERDQVRIRLDNLGRERTRAVLQAGEQDRLADAEIAPGAHIVLWLPRNAFPLGEPPGLLTLRWNRETTTIPVR